MEKLTRSQVKYRVARARSEKRPAVIKNVDLSGVNLSNLDLRHVTFSEIKCYGTVFTRADLRNAAFADCDLSRADFAYTDARQVSFQRCGFDPDRWYMADLTGMDFGMSNVFKPYPAMSVYWLVIHLYPCARVIVIPIPDGWVRFKHEEESPKNMLGEHVRYTVEEAYIGGKPRPFAYTQECSDSLLNELKRRAERADHTPETLRTYWRKRRGDK